MLNGSKKDASIDEDPKTRKGWTRKKCLSAAFLICCASWTALPIIALLVWRLMKKDDVRQNGEIKNE